jgi:hypothetical protein
MGNTMNTSNQQWDSENGYLDPENGWYDKDHPIEYYEGVWDTLVFLRDTNRGDFFDTMLAHTAQSLLPEEYTEQAFEV